MTRPSPFDFLLGHRASLVLTSGASALTLFACVQHAVSWLVAVFAVALCRAAFAARRRVSTWRNWRNAVSEMQEPEPWPQPPAIATGPAAAVRPSASAGEPQAATRARGLVARREVLPIVWALLLYYLVSHTDQGPTDAYGAASLLWLALSAWGAGVVLLALGRRLFAHSAPMPRLPAPPPEAEDEVIFAQCLPVPRAAPRTGHVRDVLPDYCQALLAQETTTSSADTVTAPPERTAT